MLIVFVQPYYMLCVEYFLKNSLFYIFFFANKISYNKFKQIKNKFKHYDEKCLYKNNFKHLWAKNILLTTKYVYSEVLKYPG